jgi:peptide/nickel transport system substrate-binding protein
METAYQLRPALTWHDGQPLAPEDFVFSWRLAVSTEFGAPQTLPWRLIDDVAALDHQTVLVRWNQSFPGADTSVITPLPRHILEGPYQLGRHETFLSHPYWTREYVGLGPFRLVRWEPGAFIEIMAFEGHVLGRPKLDSLKIIFVGDPNTAMSNMLAGAAHLTWDRTLEFEHGVLLKRRWGESTNDGRIIFSPDRSRYIVTQFNTEYTNPAVILDLRVRQALAHALDKQELVRGLMGDEGQVADAMAPTTMDYFPEIDRAITRYPYDLRRTAQLLGEAGLARSADGWYTSGAGERFSPELRGAASGQEEQEVSIIADMWRRGGVDTRLLLTTEVQDLDRVFRSTFPAFLGSGTGV